MTKKLFLLLLLTSSFCFSQEDYFTHTKAKFDQIKVYFSGVMTKQSFSADVSKGNNFVFVENFGKTDISSIEYQANKDVNVISIERVEDNFSKWNLILFEKELEKINDSTSIYTKTKKSLENDLQINKTSVQILKDNQVVEKGNTEQIVQMINFNKLKLKELYKEDLEITNKIKSLDEKMRSLETNRSELYDDVRKKNMVVFYVSSKTGQKVKFDISSYSNDANWRPFYRIESSGIKAPIKIKYKALIRQNTGIEWKNMPITLVAGDFNSQNKPYELDRWFLQTERREYVNNQAFQRQSSNNYQTASVAEVALTGNTIRQKLLKTEIELDKNTVIPNSSQRDVPVDINSFEITTEYKYFTTPKLENKTFLLAYIADYSKYNLLPGTAEIYIEDTKVGTATIDTDQFTSKMMISLGSDSNIITKRNLSNLISKELVNNQKSEQYEYEITLKNNKDVTINVEVRDQIPLTNDSSVKIDFINPSGAEIQKETGLVTWNINLKPGETKLIKFGFLVTLPKEVIINNLK